MSLFGSKRRRVANPQPLTTSTAHSDAATAALSAFSRREASPSLSEAAAAAALRANPHQPTDVSSVVPRRRSVRRSASNSSHGTASPRPTPERAGSVGSMKDRTFRSPSPHNRQHLGGGGAEAGATAKRPQEHDGAPPVPSIPTSVQGRQQQQQPQPRPESLRIANTPVRLASQKLKDDGAGSTGTWFGAPAVGDLSNVRTSDAPALNTSDGVAPAQDSYSRPESRSSVNFSYPSRLRVGSPPPQSPVAQQDRRQLGPAAQSQPRTRRPSTTSAQPTRLASTTQRPVPLSSALETVYDPNSRRMVPKAELLALQQMLDDPGMHQSPRKKKPSRAGSYLTKGTVSRSQGSEVTHRSPGVAPASPPAASPRNPQVATQASVETEIERRGQDESQPVGSVAEKEYIGGSATAPEGKDPTLNVLSPSNHLPEVVVARQCCSPPTETKSPDSVVGNRPLVTEEQAEMEAACYSHPHPPHQRSDALDSVMMRQYMYDRPSTGFRPQQLQSPQHSPQPVQTTTAPAELSAEVPDVGRTSESSEEDFIIALKPKPTNVVRSERAQSNSPVRVAHFGPVQRTLSVRHSPPPRSISPKKSALKQNSPPRSASSTEDGAEAAIASHNQDGAPPVRRKSVRVSFDDRETVLVGDEPSAVHSQPAESSGPSSAPSSRRRTWFSNIGRSKKDPMPLDDDEVMKPRPALPSFGSVREKKKPREEEERALVRPTESAYSASRAESPPSQSIKTGTEADRHSSKTGQSSDRVVSGVGAQDFASRIPANTSRFREPLPPVVTSREGSGYVSYSDSSSDSDEELLQDTPMLSTEHSEATTVPHAESEMKPSDSIVVPSEAVAAAPANVPKDDENGEPAGLAQREPAPEASPGPLLSSASSEPNPSPAQILKPTPERLPVPGGFPEEESDDTSEQHMAQESTAVDMCASEVQLSPAPGETVTDAQNKEKESAEMLAARGHASAADDSDSDGTSIYSDAYEELSGVDDHGFQSIDAVVERPFAVNVSLNPSEAPQLSGVSSNDLVNDRSSLTVPAPAPAPEEEETAVAPSPRDEWEAAKAYWRSLTADKRAQLEKEASAEAGADADLDQDAREEVPKPRRKKSIEKRQAEKTAIKTAHANPDRVYMIKPGTKVKDEVVGRVSSTNKQEQGPQDVVPDASRALFRKSLRGSVPAQQQRAQPSKPPPDARRPGLAHANGTTPAPWVSPALSTTRAAAGAAHRVHHKTNLDLSSPQQRSGPISSFFPPVLKRRGSTSSESSFRRSTSRRVAAASPTSEGGSFSLRRTLRGSVSPDGQLPEPSRRFSLRSFSPADSTHREMTLSAPPASMRGKPMRTSLRDSQSKVRRESGLGGGGMHLPSFGLKSRSSKRNGRQSRFDDSSDDDGGGVVSGFRSRFEDSSDEEASAPPPLPALSVKTTRSDTSKGASLPRPKALQEEEEPPDAPKGSDKENAASSSKTKVGWATLSASKRQTRPTFAERSGPGRGSLSGIGGAQASRQALGTSLMRGGARNVTGSNPPASPATSRRGSFMSAVLGRRKLGLSDPGKIQRGELMDSAARRDTPLERSAKELSAMRLHKRAASMPIAQAAKQTIDGSADDWPLTKPAPADGQKGGSRPSFLKRRSFSQGDIVVSAASGNVVTEPNDMEEPPPMAAAGERQKKKFSALRRMFRLDD